MRQLIHRDEVHGDVHYDPLARALLDTSSLQRLGRIYQLGYGHLVYRGGTHTRLSHVMGAYATAGNLVDALRRNYGSDTNWPAGVVPPTEFLPASGNDDCDLETRWEALRYICGWAALLHDLAHVPLGHTLEDEFEGLYKKHDDICSPRLRFLWFEETQTGRKAEIRRILADPRLRPGALKKLELREQEDLWRTLLLICFYKEQKEEGAGFSDVVDKLPPGKVKSTLKRALTDLEGVTFFPYMADIIANTICADYLDYLQRDPRNLGLDVLKDDRVVSRFWIGRSRQEKFRMALSLEDTRGKPRLDTCTQAVDLVRQRYRFAEIVYYHKTKVAASAMLAKVFHLIGKPEEIPKLPDDLDLLRVDSLAQELIEGGLRRSKSLQKRHFPSALLAPEIGDETLHLLLEQQAWGQLADAVKAKHKEKVSQSLQAICLLRYLTRRKLYKVCFSLNKALFGDLRSGLKVAAGDLEKGLLDFIQLLRNSASERARLEANMVEAASLPENSIILYVPPRKSQAKGIETGALSNGDVVTLGEHWAVREEVGYLSEKYKQLWRLLIFVHPDLRSESVRLSEAVDCFISEALKVDPTEEVGAMRMGSWFNYLEKRDRPSADIFQDMMGEDVSWTEFQNASKTLDGNTGDQDRADRACLLWELQQREDFAGDSIRLVRELYPAAEAVSEALGNGIEVRARTGEEPNARRLSLRKLAQDLAKQQGTLFE